MAQRIVTDCDVHAASDEIVEARAYDIAVRGAGDAFVFVTVDLCDEHAKTVVDLLGELGEVGRPFDDVSAKQLRSAVGAKKRPAAARSTASVQAHHSAPTGAELPFACPECGKGLATRQGLGAHRSRAHGYRVDQGEARAGE